MRMCAQLRALHSKMHGFFGDRSDKVAGVNRKKLLHLIDFMINTGERTYGRLHHSKPQQVCQKGRSCCSRGAEP